MCVPICASVRPNPPEWIGVNANSGYLEKKRKEEIWRMVKNRARVNEAKEEVGRGSGGGVEKMNLQCE